MDSILPKNRIEIKDSLHAKTRQSSSYVKIEDNVLNFNFDRSKRAGKRHLSEQDVQKLGTELNRINLSFLSLNDVEKRRKVHL